MRRRGLTLLELLVVIAIIGILIALLLPAVQRVRAAAEKTTCANRLRQIGLGLHQFHGAHDRLPHGLVNEERKLGFWINSGWLIHVLPYVEQQAVYEQARVDYTTLNPSPHFPYPHRGLSTHVRNYVCPGDPRVQVPVYVPTLPYLNAVAFTSYVGVNGTDESSAGATGVLYVDSRTRLTDIRDGTSNTLMVGERPPGKNLAMGSWYSVGSMLGVRERPGYDVTVMYECTALGRFARPPLGFEDPCGGLNFWSPHAGGGYFALADGSVRFLRYEADALMPALASRAGGEVAALPD